MDVWMSSVPRQISFEESVECFIFVHDGINSVADYDSLRVGVGWMDVGWMSDGCRMDVGWMCLRGKFHDWITSKRLEILS